MSFLEQFIANIWNRASRLFDKQLSGGLALGRIVSDGAVTNRLYFLPHSKRAEHISILGKTGQGKSFLLLSLCLQDIHAGRGFAVFDPHGALIPLIVRAIALEEKRSGVDLSSKVIVIEPGNPNYSVGFNPLQVTGHKNSFVSIAGIAAIIKERWGLSHFGPQTEEILRNSLHVLADNKLTLIELSPLLSNASFRSKCLKQVSNPEVKDYFENRFEVMSEPMKAMVRNPVLNKTSEFASDPHFRHILGQQHSTFSVVEALDSGKILLVDLNKGLLGKHFATLGSLLMAQLSSAIFARTNRKLYSLYLDEIQNLLTVDADLDVLLSEARKYGVSISKQQSKEGLVFTFNGNPITRIKTAWKAALKRAKVQAYRFKDLRSTFNSRLLEAGVIKDVRKELMGHSRNEDTNDLYSHIELPTLRQAIARLEQWHSEQLEKLSKEANETQEADSGDKGSHAGSAA